MIVFDPAKPKGIVWLASYPKSGNTWLRMFLYQLARIRRGLPREDDEINQITRASRWDTDFVRLYEHFLGKATSEASQEETIAVRTRVHGAIAYHSPGLAFIKTHSLLGAYGKHQTLNTDVSAGAVYIVRDPRDVAISLARHLAMTLDEAVTRLNEKNTYATGEGRVVGEPWGSWSQNVESWVKGANDTLLAVRYEDMFGEPTDTFTRIVAHLRQRATATEMAEAIRLSSFDELRSQEERHGFHLRTAEGEQFFASGKIGGWRDKLTAAHVDSIIDAHGPMMKKFGYLD